MISEAALEPTRLGTSNTPINAPQINIKGPRPKAAGATRRQRSLHLTTPTENEYNTIAPPTPRTRPRHGDHKWMRQLSTIESNSNPDDLLNDLLTQGSTGMKPPTPFPYQDRNGKPITDQTYSGYYETQGNSSSMQLSQESYFAPFVSSTHGKSQSLPRLLLEAESRLPRLTTPRPTPSGLLVDQRSKMSSIPKLPKIGSTSLVSPLMDAGPIHRRSRSFSDPIIQPVYNQRV